jgi:hypothetical protein
MHTAPGNTHDQLSVLVDNANRAAQADSNDQHIAALTAALDLALDALGYRGERSFG